MIQTPVTLGGAQTWSSVHTPDVLSGVWCFSLEKCLKGSVFGGVEPEKTQCKQEGGFLLKAVGLRESLPGSNEPFPSTKTLFSPQFCNTNLSIYLARRISLRKLRKFLRPKRKDPQLLAILDPPRKCLASH